MLELKKRYIHMSRRKGEALSQVTLDDDFNVPDQKPDLIKIIQDKGNIKIEEVKVSDGHIWITGMLEFAVLYKSDQMKDLISYLNGSIPFQENLSMDEVGELDLVKVTGELEDLSINMINSRKLSVRALMVLRATAEDVWDEELTYDIEADKEIEQRRTTLEAMQLVMAKKDSCRFKNEMILPANKPNIEEVLWKSVQLRNLETHLKNGNIEVTGEAFLFLIYNGTEEDERLQWMENTIPLLGEVECNLKEEDLISFIAVEPGLIELEVRPDYDGEERMLVLDVVLSLDIHAWREEDFEILEDVYSLETKITPEYENIKLDKFLMKNETKCKISDKITIPKDKGNILQICACEGAAFVEKQHIEEDKVAVNGTVKVTVLFVTADDAVPISAVTGIIPFEQLIEVEGITEEARYELTSGIEQISGNLIDNGQVEIKAVVQLNLIAFDGQPVHKMKVIQEEEMDMNELQKCPGITGYVVREQDSLWNIAKENHTTIQNIIDTNELTDSLVSPGEKILITKMVHH